MVSVLFVRHADIDPPHGEADPPLNAAGRERAETLARMVDPAGLKSLFCSPKIRTKQTVQPIEARSGLSAEIAPDPAELAKQLLSMATDAVVLVAGHSNTVPAMIEALGVAPPAPVIGEQEFDNLFIVTVDQPARPTLLHLKYGNPSQ
jgi:broad specificity phosphatase PhoE